MSFRFDRFRVDTEATASGGRKVTRFGSLSLLLTAVARCLRQGISYDEAGFRTIANAVFSSTSCSRSGLMCAGLTT